MHFQTHIQYLIVDHDQQDGGGGHGDQQDGGGGHGPKQDDGGGHGDQEDDGGGHGSGAPVCKHPWPSSSRNTSVEPSTPELIKLAKIGKKLQDKKSAVYS